MHLPLHQKQVRHRIQVSMKVQRHQRRKLHRKQELHQNHLWLQVARLHLPLHLPLHQKQNLELKVQLHLMKMNQNLRYWLYWRLLEVVRFLHLQIMKPMWYLEFQKLMKLWCFHRKGFYWRQQHLAWIRDH